MIDMGYILKCIHQYVHSAQLSTMQILHITLLIGMCVVLKEQGAWINMAVLCGYTFLIDMCVADK